MTVRGFAVGTLALVALYVGLQAGGVRAAEQGSGWLVAGLRRFMSPEVAGIPNRAGPAKQNKGTESGG